MRRRSALSCCLLALLSLGACATERPAPLPSLPSSADPAVAEAHANAERAWTRCEEDMAQDAIPWAGFLSLGAGLFGAGFAGGAVATTYFVDDPAVRAGGAVGLLFGAAAGAAASTWFLTEAIPQGARYEAEQKVLADSRARADAALAQGDSRALLAVARELYENCRAIQAARDEQAIAALIRDLMRYRRDAEAKDAQLHGVLAEREALERVNEKLSARLVDTEAALAKERALAKEAAAKAEAEAERSP